MRHEKLVYLLVSLIDLCSEETKIQPRHPVDLCLDVSPEYILVVVGHPPPISFTLALTLELHTPATRSALSKVYTVVLLMRSKCQV